MTTKGTKTLKADDLNAGDCILWNKIPSEVIRLYFRSELLLIRTQCGRELHVNSAELTPMPVPSQLLSWHCTSCKKLGSLFFPLSGEERQAAEAMRSNHRDRSPGCLAVLERTHFGTGGQSTFAEQPRRTLDEFFNAETI